MSLARLLADLRRRDPVLTAAGAVLLAGLFVAATLSLVDTRTILGLNPWIKPMKFMVSIAIFFWTMAWFMPEADERRARRLARIRWTFVVTLFGEVLLISMQSARGTTSHFNVATPFDAVVFNLMGAMIVANTIAAGAFLFTLRRHVPAERAGYLRGLRLGLVLFILGSLEGFVMTTNLAHTVAQADGGPGLPFVNWSTVAGDLRIAHFLALHGLQALPLAGYALDRWWRGAPAVRAGLVSLAAAAWFAVAGGALLLALAGRPLLAR